MKGLSVQTDQGNSHLTLCRGGGGASRLCPGTVWPHCIGVALPESALSPQREQRSPLGWRRVKCLPAPHEPPQPQPHALPKPVALAIFTQACGALGRPLLSRTHLQRTQTPSCNLCLPIHLQAPPGTPPAPRHPHTCRTRPGQQQLLCLLPLLGVTELKCQLPNIQNVPLP